MISQVVAACSYNVSIGELCALHTYCRTRADARSSQSAPDLTFTCAGQLASVLGTARNACLNMILITCVEQLSGAESKHSDDRRGSRDSADVFQRDSGFDVEGGFGVELEALRTAMTLLTHMPS